MKITPESMKKQYEELLTTFCKKNHDYGSSFEQSLDKHGLVAGVVRMEDKMNRLSTLVDSDTDAKIAYESLIDALMDLANYSTMAACWLEGPDENTRDEETTESGQFTGLKVWGDDIGEGFSGSVTTTMGIEEVEKTLHLSSFEGHQEKVNERAYYEKDGISDEEIIKNWGLVGDSKTVRSRTTGQYLVEDDNPELFHKIFGVLQKHHHEEKTRRDNIEADMESDIEVMYRKVRDSKDKPLLTDPKGLENGYFIRQYINDEEYAPRYTLAFNPEGTVKTQIGYELPYVIECYGNNHDGMTRWSIHVFNTRQDMVAALNYDLKVRDRYSSKNFGDSIGELNITRDVLSIENTTPVFAAWMVDFGVPFIKNMMSRDIFSDGYFSIKQGIKTFGPVFISEKTGSLVVMGVIRERYSDRNHNFVWFSDTEEILYT